MPAGVIKNKKDFRMWKKAKKYVKKSKDYSSMDDIKGQDWGLVTNIFKQMKSKYKDKKLPADYPKGSGWDKEKKKMKKEDVQSISNPLELSDEAKKIFEMLPVFQVLEKIAKEIGSAKSESVEAFMNQFEGEKKEDDGLPILIPQPVKHVQAQPNHGLPELMPSLNQDAKQMEVVQAPVAQVVSVEKVMADLEALKQFVISHGRGMPS